MTIFFPPDCAVGSAPNNKLPSLFWRFLFCTKPLELNRPWIAYLFDQGKKIFGLFDWPNLCPCFFLRLPRVYALSGHGSPRSDASGQGRTPTGAAKPLPAGILPANVALLAFGPAETAGFRGTQSRARPTAGRRRRLHRSGQFPRVHLRAARVA